MKKIKYRTFLPYLLPVLTIVFLSVFFAVQYSRNSGTDFRGITGFAIAQTENYLVEGTIRVNQNYVNNTCFLNLVIKDKEIIDSINLTQDFFKKTKLENDIFYFDINETSLKTQLDEGNYTLVVRLYCNDVLIENLEQDIVLDKNIVGE
jgi:hypothetical protein